MDDLGGPSCLVVPKPGAWGLFSSDLACRKGWKDLITCAKSVPQGACSVELEICISGHIRLRAMNYLRSGG